MSPSGSKSRRQPILHVTEWRVAIGSARWSTHKASATCTWVFTVSRAGSLPGFLMLSVRLIHMTKMHSQSLPGCFPPTLPLTRSFSNCPRICKCALLSP